MTMQGSVDSQGNESLAKKLERLFSVIENTIGITDHAEKIAHGTRGAVERLGFINGSLPSSGRESGSDLKTANAVAATPTPMDNLDALIMRLGNNNNQLVTINDINDYTRSSLDGQLN